MAEKKDEPAAAEAAAAGKKKKPLPLLAGLFVGVVFAAGALTELMIVPTVSTRLAPKAPVLPAEAVVEEPQVGEVHVIDDLIVNPAGSGGTRYIAASIGIEAFGEEALAEMQNRDVQIKDALIGILGARTVEDLGNVEVREQIRGEIKQRVEALVPIEKAIGAVYFVRFVLQ